MIRNGSTWVFSPPFVNSGSRVIYHGWTMDLRGMYTTEMAKRRPKHEKDRFMRRFVKQREEIGGEKTSMGLLWWWWWARVADVKLHTYRACTMCVYVMNKNTHTHTHTPWSLHSYWLNEHLTSKKVPGTCPLSDRGFQQGIYLLQRGKECWMKMINQDCV